MSKDLIPADVLANFPTQIGDDAAFTALATSVDFLQRMQLISKGKYVDSRQCQPGDFAVIIDSEKAQPLGQRVDVMVFARRPKAIDMSNTEAIVISYAYESDLFKDIAERSGDQDSGCQYGVSFLVVERSTASLYEFFCGTSSMRREIGNISAYMPLSAEEIKAKKLKDVDPHGPLPMSMVSKNVRKGKWSWFVPVVEDCSTPFTPDQIPSPALIRKEFEKFVNPPADTTKIQDSDKERRAR